jgi:hypothetical protein
VPGVTPPIPPIIKGEVEKRFSTNCRGERKGEMASASTTSRSRTAPAPAPAAVLGTSKVSLEGMDYTIDLKGLSHIPGNLNEEPLRSQRLLLFTKGSALHVPNLPGAYVTNKPFKVIVAPCMVSFSESSGLEDQLVLSFTDHSLASSTMAGIGIVTLDFPLKVRHNVWKGDNDAQIKSLASVTTLYPIDTKDLKYIDVNPTLKHYPLLNELSVACPPDALQWISRKLEEKVELLVKRALKEAESHAAVVRATDTRAAAATLTRHTAQIEKLKSDLEALGYDQYDRRINDRIQSIDLDNTTTAADGMDWLSSPLRCSLASGRAVRGDTILKVRRSISVIDRTNEAAPTATAQLPTVTEEPENELEQGNSETAGGSDAQQQQQAGQEKSGNESNDSDDEAYAYLRKRNRTSPKRFEAGAVQPKKGKKRNDKSVKEKEPKKGKKALPVSDSSRIGTTNPRTGMPYTREPYV